MQVLFLAAEYISNWFIVGNIVVPFEGDEMN